MRQGNATAVALPFNITTPEGEMLAARHAEKGLAPSPGAGPSLV